MSVSSATAPSCQEVRAQLSRYTQGDLSLPETQRIYAHLIQCKSCRQPAPSRSITLPFGVLATAGSILLLLYSAYLPTPNSVASPATLPSSLSRPLHGFSGEIGSAYYVRIQVNNRFAAENSIGRILAEAPLLKAKGPYAARYYIIATSDQMEGLLGRLREVGDAGIVRVGNRRQWPNDPMDPGACSVTLDLIPA